MVTETEEVIVTVKSLILTCVSSLNLVKATVENLIVCLLGDDTTMSRLGAQAAEASTWTSSTESASSPAQGIRLAEPRPHSTGGSEPDTNKWTGSSSYCSP